MSTPTAVADAELAKILRDNEDYILSVTKSKAVDLSKKMFQTRVISKSMMDQFSSLDHSRVEPQLQLRYLLRLVAKRIKRDGSVEDKFVSLLESLKEHKLCEFVKMSSTEKDMELTTNDILWILEILAEASPKWEMLGIALGLPTYQIKNIKGDDNLTNLQRVVAVWLSGESNAPLTVSILTSALRSKIVGQGRLAQEIEEKFISLDSPKTVLCSNITETSRLALTITHQSSREVEVEDNKSTLLLVQASHRENVSYQWNKNGQPLTDNHTYSGVQDNILIINHAHQGTRGEYTCIVSYLEKEAISNKVTLTVLYPPEKKALLDLYSVNTHASLDNAWLPVGAEIFINLVLVKSSRQSIDTNLTEVLDQTEKIEYEEVFGMFRSAALILVEGRPGSGKTTLVHKLITDWAKGNTFFQAKLVFLVSLRMLVHDTSQDNSLLTLLGHLYPNAGADLVYVISNLEGENGEGACFVFDGLDEYHPQLKDKSVVFRLLHKSYLPRAMIIVSSRPGAMKRLRPEVVTQHIKVFGFSENQISEVLYPPEKKARVRHYESVADNAAIGHITDEEKKEVKLNTADKLQKEVEEVSNGSTVNSEAQAPTDNQEKGIQDLDAGFENFSEDVTEALLYDKKLEKNIANINIVGLPEGGKTCLLHRLINRTVKENLPSTGVCDATIMVDVAPASIFLEACPVDKDGWVVVDIKESFVKQVGECRSQSSGMDPNSKECSLEMTEESPSGADISVTKPIKNASSTIKGFRLSHHKKLQENVKSVLQKHNLKNFHDLKNVRSIYLRDTGGQLEFQESLSLLICGPSMVLFVFNASIDIDTPQSIKYRMEGRVISEFNSRISTKDALLQCLASVFATHVSRSVEAVVYIIGTHVDKLKNPDEEVEQIDEKIKEIVESTKFSDMVKYCNPTQLRMIYTVNNFATSDADFKEIRDHISKVLLTPNFTVEYPVSYLLFSLDILGINKNIINLKDCEAIAAKYNITSQVVPDLLQFLNDKTGIIQWYNIPGLSNLIIKEPQIFYNKITNLIINTFSSPDLHSLPISVVKEMQSKGLFEASLFNKLIEEDDEFPPKQFVQFLTHLRMVAVYQDESGDEKYFIPCILKHAPEPPADSDLMSPIQVLSFAFKCGHCPKGLFSNLIAHLIMLNKEKEKALVFLLQEKKVFRDQVSFLVSSEEEQDEITFKMLSSHLEVHFFPEESDDRDSLNGICIKIRELLEGLITESLTNLKYDAERVGVEVCLSCSECISLGRHVVKFRTDETGYIHSCNRKKLSKVAPWFLEKETSVSNLPASSSELSIDNVEIVRKEIWNARSKWYHIGLALQLSSGTLDAIKRSATGVDDQCTEMLQEWLRSGANKTWENLAEVMKSETIGHFDISRMIRNKYCQ